MNASSTLWPMSAFLIAMGSAFSGWMLGRSGEAPALVPAPEAAVAAPASPWPLVAPDPASVPDGPLGDAIRRGDTIVRRTRETLPDKVGNGLHCTSCHLSGGTVAKAGPWIGVTGVFPEYRARSGRVNTLQDRINDCFERSLNGAPLDPAGEDMTAIVAYMTWLSRDVPTGTPVEGRGFAKIKDPPTPDPAAGQALFAERCASCHGADGAGLRAADGGTIYPALWGEQSFNLGAGMARLDTAAAFVRWNMPLGQGGSLTDQQAYDLAAFFTAQDRPDYAGKAGDWPRGDRPRDARY